MFDIPHVHISVKTECKFSLECEQNFIPTLMEIGSVFHSI